MLLAVSDPMTGLRMLQIIWVRSVHSMNKLTSDQDATCHCFRSFLLPNSISSTI